MRYYTHIVGSLLIALLFAIIFSIKPGALYLFVAGAAAPILDLLDSFMGTHERKTHNIFVIIGSLTFIFINFQIGIAIFAAVFSHIILDLFTVHGCPLLYPLKEIKFVCLNRKNRVKTGTKKEKALFLFFLVIVIGAMLGNYQVFAAIDHQTSNINNASEVNVSNNSSNLTGNIKTYTNVNIQGDKVAGEKNITVKSNGNETNIIIKNLESKKNS